MSYREYVIAAYAVFAAMLVWDYAAPRLAIARQLRACTRALPSRSSQAWAAR